MWICASSQSFPYPVGRLRPPCVLCDEMPAAAEELKHVIVLNTHTDSSGKRSTNPQVHCVHCSHTFRGGATRIRGHLAHTQGCGVSFCDQVPADTKLHFKEVHTSKLEISAKKRHDCLASYMLFSAVFYADDSHP